MAAIDLFPESFAQNLGIDAPIVHAQATTGDDAVDLTYVSRALLVGVAGNVKVDLRGDVKKNIPAVQGIVLPVVAGWNPMRVSRVYLTGLTASAVNAVT